MSHRFADAKARVGLPLLILTVLCVSVGAAIAPARSAGNGGNPPDNPQSLPTTGCFWTGPFTREEPKTNVAFPGTEITYWAAKFATPADYEELTLEGRFPYARYSSLNSYDNLGASQSSLPDSKIDPDPGSINTSKPGSNRKATNRSYSVDVVDEEPPPSPRGNTLYAKPTPDGYQVIIYRVYIPDDGRGLAGGTDVPKPTLRLDDGRKLSGEALCDELNVTHSFPSTTMGPQTYENLVNWSGRNPVTNPAENPLQFSRYWNLENAIARYKTKREQEATWRAFPNYVGTQYDNSDARYMTGAFSFRYGPVLVLKGKLPTTPRTLNGQRRMTSGQLVAWDMCVIQSLVTTRTWDCVFDEQLPLRGGKKRQYTIVISSKANRPKNARSRCGVWWMSADPDGEGRLERPPPLTEWVGRSDLGFLLTRNVLPARSFRQSSWSVPTPFPKDAARTMGNFYPRGTYSSKRKFERLGCPGKPNRPKKK